ncbi:hypothetical protein Neosp_011012 [[Neocosmospora] mangrovei]
MLVLIAGATGNLGQKLIDSLHSHGHQVRALGRNPSKLEAPRREKLESFVQSEAYYDIPTLDRACKGVDVVICAYQGIPQLQLEGQLLLLRAAERSGVKTYVAHCWSYGIGLQSEMLQSSPPPSSSGMMRLKAATGLCVLEAAHSKS